VRRIRRLLVASGCSEVMPMPFLAPGDLERCGVRDDGVVVANPLVADESILRTSLLPGLIKTVAYDATHRIVGVSLFEIGRCFAQPATSGELPEEWEELAVVLAGRKAPAAVTLARRVCALLGVRDVRLRNTAVAGLHPGRSASIEVAGEQVGVVGEIDPATLETHGIGERVAYLSLLLGGPEPWNGRNGVLAVRRDGGGFRAISRYPSSDVDLAFVVPDAVGADDVAATIREAGGDLVLGASLFDVYRGPGLDGGRSLAYRVRLQAPDRTLTEAELADVRRSIIDAVAERHGATLRA
jgi:phenylalanyl-tRNA synthetase beta chain